MVDVEDDHLGGAAGFAAGLDDAGEGVKAAHEAERAGGGAAAGERSMEPRMVERLVPVPEPHLKSMPSVLARVRMESSESSTELMKQAEHCGVRVAGDGELDVAGVLVPVPVLGVGVGLEAVAADVEPDGRVEGGLLVDEQVDELGVEDVGVFGRGEVAAVEAPVADGFGDAGDELADAGFALRGADLAVEIFAGDDVGRGHGPVDGDFDVLLLEDGLAGGVADEGGAALPLDFVIGRDVGLREEAVEAQGAGFMGSSGGGSGSCD